MIETRPDGVRATLEPWSRGFRSAAAICLALAGGLVGFFAIPSAPPPEAPTPPPYAHCTAELWRSDPVCVEHRRQTEAGTGLGLVVIDRLDFELREHEAALAQYTRDRALYNARLRAKLAGAALAGVPMLWGLLLIHGRRPIHIALGAHGLTLDGTTIPISEFRWAMVDRGRLVLLRHGSRKPLESRPVSDAAAQARELVEALRPHVSTKTDHAEDRKAKHKVHAQAAKLRDRA